MKIEKTLNSVASNCKTMGLNLKLQNTNVPFYLTLDFHQSLMGQIRLSNNTNLLIPSQIHTQFQIWAGNLILHLCFWDDNYINKIHSIKLKQVSGKNQPKRLNRIIPISISKKPVKWQQSSSSWRRLSIKRIWLGLRCQTLKTCWTGSKECQKCPKRGSIETWGGRMS